MRYLWVPALCLAVAHPVMGLAQLTPLTTKAPAAATDVRAASTAKDQAVRERLQTTAACTPQTITCGSTVNGTLAPGGCTLPDGSLVAYYQFAGTTSETVTGQLSTTEFDPVLELLAPDGTTLNSSSSFQGPATIQVQSSLNVTGNWTWAVTDTASTESGNFSFKFTCGNSSPQCIPNSTTLCLNDGRFQVRATYDAGTSGSGNAQAVQLTSDTGYLWFFDATNVEAVIKVLNGCAVDNAYWVFAGGLTNVKVVMTVTDTSNNTIKTYTNPQSTEFQPIQDTSAFATCP